MSELHDRIAALEAELAALKAAVGVPDVASVAPGAPVAPVADGSFGTASSSRRSLLRGLAAGGAAAAAAGAGLLATAGPAAAADGGNFVLGQANDATASTRVNNPTSGSPGVGVNLLVQSGTSAPPGGADLSALGGWALNDGGVTIGVYGHSARTGGSGLLGRGTAGYGATLQGNIAALRLQSSGTVAEVTSISHNAGELIMTNEGDLWYCPQGPGTLRKVASAASAGQLHLLATPVRVYDSRNGDGRLSLNTRTVSLANGIGATPAPPAVPAGSTGALVSVTLDQTTGTGGFLSVYSNALAAAPGTSNLNWFGPAQTLAVTTVTAVDATARVKVTAGGAAGSGAHVIIDVLGYYR
jgi:hypothetical protein